MYRFQDRFLCGPVSRNDHITFGARCVCKVRLFVRGEIVSSKGRLARFHQLQVRADGARIHCAQGIAVRMADREVQ